MENRLFQIPAECVKVLSKANRSIRLIYDSQENLTDEAMVALMKQLQKFGWLCFLPGEEQIKAEEIPDVSLPKRMEDGDISPAQRMRNVLFRIWEQKGKPTTTFEEYYRSSMEKYISQLKERLT